MKKIKILLLLIMLFSLSGCFNKNNHVASDINNIINENLDKLVINYIDVNQGDSTLIQFPNNEVMLIDTGENEYKDNVINYIKKLGINKIDYLVGTHPHSDHIGGMKSIVDTFDIKNIYMPKVVNTTSTYINLLKAIDNKGLNINTAKNGMFIINNNDLKVEILSPNSDIYENINNYSVVLKLTYKNRSFLFMGDAENLIEDELIKNNVDVDSDVIKVGHHGSNNSSSLKFIKKVSPNYAIISVGKNNSYNHPKPEIVDRYTNFGSIIYRTDLMGNIKLTTDGDAINFETEKNEYIINNNTIELVDINSSVKKGENGFIKIKTLPNTLCSIKVMTKSGESSAQGLEDKVSDIDGIVQWNWKVSSNSSSGDYSITINCDFESKSFNYSII